MHKEQIIGLAGNALHHLVIDYHKVEQDEENFSGGHLSQWMDGFSNGLNLSEPDAVVNILKDISRHTRSPYLYYEEEVEEVLRYNFEYEIDKEGLSRAFKSSIMHLYLIIQSLLKDVEGLEDDEAYIDKLFEQVFVDI